MNRLFLAPILTLSLAACDAGGTEGPAAVEPTAAATEDAVVSQSLPDQPAADTPELRSGEADDSGCGADKLGRWLNVLPTEDAKAAIAETVGERPIRYYTQGDPITMDFSPARLNVELGEDGRIKLFRCG